MSEQHPRCEQCRFWERQSPAEKERVISLGDCHRYPVTEDTYASDWCGEFRQAKQRHVQEQK